ncbi:MAG: hypothetical protein O3A51_03490 [Verrucomicrobia bacterium]|nr:hypothetical protein [Verrucomicrobiota bacterium]
MNIGSARQTINPDVGHHLAGYGEHNICDGVHDDLSVTALSLHDGTTTALLLVYDLCGLELPMVRRIREAVAAASGVPHDHVFLHCTHVHGGPEVRTLYRRRDGRRDLTVPAYQDQLVARSAQAALGALAAPAACDMRYNFDYVDETINRRFHHHNGDSVSIPLSKDLIGQSQEFVDRELGVIAFRHQGRANRYAAVITNYTAHPLCVGNTSTLATADYPGVIRHTLESGLAGATAVATTGACGDQHPRCFESGFAEAQRLGKRLASLASSRLFDAVTAPQPTLRCVTEGITLDGAHESIDTEFWILGIGPVALVGLPGEVSSILGAHIKATSPFARTYCCHTASDAIYYLSSRNQWVWGGYETQNVIVTAGQSEKLIHAITDRLATLVDNAPFPTTGPGSTGLRHA